MINLKSDVKIDLKEIGSTDQFKEIIKIKIVFFLSKKINIKRLRVGF